MGADLYIKDLPRESQYRGFEVSQEAVDVGYFRDCYNSNGLFSWLSNNSGMTFSWWRLLNDHEKDWFRDDPDEGLLMTVDGAQKFLDLLLEAEKAFVRQPRFVKIASSKLVGKDLELVEEFETQTDEEAQEYFKWFGLLLQFLRTAIARKSEVIWSV